MSIPSQVYGALSRALAPPRGDPLAFAMLGGLREPDATALEAEHATLFGRMGRPVLSPYAGVRTRMGLHCALQAYAEAGLTPDARFRDRPDHVCVWLAVLESLARDAEAASADGETTASHAATEALEDFVKQHAEPWLPALFLEMALLRRYPLHRALAHQANWFFLGGGGERAASLAQSAPEELPDEVICTVCAKPLGLRRPEPVNKPPPWGWTCVRCRLRADLRRSAS